MTSSNPSNGAENPAAQNNDDAVQLPDMQARAERLVGADYVLDEAHPARTLRVTIGHGPKDTTTKTTELSVVKALERVCRHVQSESKEAQWEIGGHYADDATGRNDASVRGVDLLQFDFDGGDWTAEGLEAVMRSKGVAYGIYTTWSHLADGVTQKFRIAVPFAETYKSTGIGEDRDLYKRAVAHVATEWFGDTWDKACVNIARLFYTAAAPRARWEQRYSNIVTEDVALFDFNAIAKALPEPVKRKKAAPRGAAKTSDRREFDNVWRDIAPAFATARFASDVDDTAVDRGRKVETSCPFGGDHKTPDEPGKTPVIWYDASNAEHGTATVKCHHPSCEHVTADYVFALMQAAHFSVSDLRDYVEDVARLELLDAKLAAMPPDGEEIKAAFEAIEKAGEPLKVVEDAKRALEAAREELADVSKRDSVARKVVTTAQQTKDKAALALAATVKPATAVSAKDARQLHTWEAKRAALDLADEVSNAAVTALADLQPTLEAAETKAADLEEAYNRAVENAATSKRDIEMLGNGLIMRLAAMPEGLELDVATQRLSGYTGKAVSKLSGLIKAESKNLQRDIDEAKPERVNADGGDDFARGENGRPVSNKLTNAAMAFARLGVTFRDNLFSGRTYVEGLDGCALRLMRDADISQLIEECERFEDRDAFTPTSEAVTNAIKNEARRNAWHPVRDYLDGLQWDGVPRVDKWLHTYLRAEDTALNGEYGKRWLIAAVSRIYQPGTKYDRCLLLISEQGTGKSTALNILAGEGEWFTDSMDIDSDSKEAIEQSGGKWIVELSELGGMRKADVDRVKAFLSRQTDTARMSYARVTEDRPRQFICAATTNNDKPLKDETGNRRFEPVRVGKTREDDLRRDRDQLFAEVMALYRAGETCNLRPEFYAKAAETQLAHRIENNYTERLEDKLGSFPAGRLASRDAYLLAGLSESGADTYKARDVKSALEALGWTKKEKVEVAEGKRVNGFERGKDGPVIVAQLDADKRTYNAAVAYVGKDGGLGDLMKRAEGIG